MLLILSNIFIVAIFLMLKIVSKSDISGKLYKNEMKITLHFKVICLNIRRGLCKLTSLNCFDLFCLIEIKIKHQTYFVDGFYFRKGPFHNLLLSNLMCLYLRCAG